MPRQYSPPRTETCENKCAKRHPSPTSLMFEKWIFVTCKRTDLLKALEVNDANVGDIPQLCASCGAHSCHVSIPHLAGKAVGINALSATPHRPHCFATSVTCTRTHLLKALEVNDANVGDAPQLCASCGAHSCHGCIPHLAGQPAGKNALDATPHRPHCFATSVTCTRTHLSKALEVNDAHIRSVPQLCAYALIYDTYVFPI